MEAPPDAAGGAPEPEPEVVIPVVTKADGHRSSESSGRKHVRRASIFGIEFTKPEKASKPQGRRRDSVAGVVSVKSQGKREGAKDLQQKRRYSEANYKKTSRTARVADEEQQRRRHKEGRRVSKESEAPTVAPASGSTSGSSKPGNEAAAEGSSRRHRRERRDSLVPEPVVKPTRPKLLGSLTGTSDTKTPLWLSTNKEPTSTRPTSSRHSSSHHHRSPEEKEAARVRREEKRAREEARSREERRERRREEERQAAREARPEVTNSTSRSKGHHHHHHRRRRSEVEPAPPTIKDLAVSGLRRLLAY